MDFDKYFLKLTNVPTDQMLTMLSGDRRQWNYATIRMRDSAVDGAVLASLAGVKGLLSLDVQAVSPDAFAAENWRGFDSLQQLKLLDCERADLSFVSVLPALNRLALTGCARGERSRHRRPAQACAGYRWWGVRLRTGLSSMRSAAAGT